MVMTLMMMNCEVDSACMRKWMVGALSRILDRPEQTTDDSPLSAYDDHITIVQHEHFQENDTFYIILLIQFYLCEIDHLVTVPKTQPLC